MRISPNNTKKKSRRFKKTIFISIFTIVIIPTLVATYQVFLSHWLSRSSPTSPITSASNSPHPIKSTSKAAPSTTTHPPSDSTTTMLPTISPSPTATTTPRFIPKDITLDDSATEQACKWGNNTGYRWHSLQNLDIEGETQLSLGNTVHTKGFACQMRRNEATGYVDATIPPGAATLTATAGQIDKSKDTDATVTFEIINISKDGNIVLETHTLTITEVAEFNVPIEGMTRVRLQATVHSNTPSVDLWAAWAEPKLS